MDISVFLQEHYLLVIGILLCLFFLIEEELSSYLSGKFRIDPEEVLNMQNKGAVLHDIRDRSSYNAGHIGSAKHSFIDFLQEKPETILDKKHKHILYCNTGAKSCELASILRAKRGYEVYYLTGGIELWKEEGFTLTKR